jgi:hypothetical protein
MIGEKPKGVLAFSKQINAKLPAFIPSHKPEAKGD